MLNKIIVLIISCLLSKACLSISYTIGVESVDYYPHSKVDTAGQYVGFGRALLDAFAAKQGYNFIYIPLPIERLLVNYLSDNSNLDFKYPDNPHWIPVEKKGHQIHYSLPVVRYIDGALVINKLKGKGIASLKSMSMLRGFTPFGYEEAIKNKQLTIIEDNNTNSVLRMALKDRTQAVYGNISIYTYLLGQLSSKYSISYDPSLPHTDDHYYLSSIKHPEIIKEFNKFLIEEKTMVFKIKEQFKVEDGLE